jgi:serine protease Do
LYPPTTAATVATRRIPILGVAAFVLICCVTLARAEGLARVERSPVPESPFTAVAREAGASVVSIRVIRDVSGGVGDLGPMEDLYRRYFPEDGDDGASPFRRSGSGTGFVVSELGYILTNNHVIARADEVGVRFSGDDETYPAVVVGADPASDLAVLKIEAGRPLPSLVFGDSESVRVGDWAIAVGNPFGNLAGSVTVGVVSAKGRNDLAIHGGAPRYQDFLQTDAAINFGNSGGPLLDITGRVIGVNTAVNKAGQGIGFAIPSNYAVRIFEQLAAEGRVIRGWMGAVTSDFRDGSRAGGALVESLVPGSPAQKAGLLPGDVIVSFDGVDVAVDRELQFLVSDAELGRDIPVRCLRDGRGVDLVVVLVEEPADAADRHRGEEWLGMATVSLDSDDPRAARLREAFGVEGDRGVLVVSVDTESPAGRAGLRPGDLILAVNDRPVGDQSEFDRLRDELGSAPGDITLLVESGGQRSYLLLDVDPGS